MNEKLSGTSTTKLRGLNIKNDGHVLTDEQYVQAIIRLLPNNWEYMRVNITHNYSIKTFNDIKCHLELDDDRLEAAKTSSQLCMDNSKPH